MESASNTTFFQCSAFCGYVSFASATSAETAPSARATLDRVDAMFGAEGAVSADAVLAKETYPQKAEHWKKVVFDALSKLV